jgi:hypothetical protein
MAYNRIQAGRLLGAAELQVFEASLGKTLAALTAAKLRVLIKRARAMRDKARDLLQRQRVATRDRTGNKGGTTGAANERTAQKVQVLGEALARFEGRLAQLDAAAERAAGATLRAGGRPGPAKQRVRASAAKATPKAAPESPATAQTSLKSAVKAAVVAAQASEEQTAGQASARSTKAPTTASRRAGTGRPPGSSGADAKGMVQQRKFTGSQAIQASVGARGRRVQAKRDKR